MNIFKKNKQIKEKIAKQKIEKKNILHIFNDNLHIFIKFYIF